MPAIRTGSKQAINESGKFVVFVGMTPDYNATTFLQDILVGVDANAVSHRRWSRPTSNIGTEMIVPFAMWYLLEKCVCGLVLPGFSARVGQRRRS